MMTDDEQRQHLEALLQTYRRRQRYLEHQIATFGPRTPPEVRIELADVEAEIARIITALYADPAQMSELKRLWYRALTAFFARNWPEAEMLLAQVHAIHPGYEDVQARLAEAQRQRKFHEFYAYLCDMREQDAWVVVLNALEELAQQYPGFPDPEGLRLWAERRRRREQDTKLCPACGEINPAHLALCLRCGTRIIF